LKFLKKHKGKIISLLSVLAILLFAYSLGGDIPEKKAQEKPRQIVQTEVSIPEIKEEKAPLIPEKEKVNTEEKEDTEYIILQGMKINRETGVDEYETEPVPEGKPAPIEPQTVTISDKEMKCTLSIRCDALLGNLDKLEKAKWDLVPKDGIILAEKTVIFYEGESVFNVLLRETRRNGIHMEYVSTPIYNSAYIEGIHNLYEFDCGELSGWMYSVNGWYPNYGCSRYALKEGDRIEWEYTCSLGKDVK